MKKILFMLPVLVLSLGVMANTSEAAKKKGKKNPTIDKDGDLVAR